MGYFIQLLLAVLLYEISAASAGRLLDYFDIDIQTDFQA